MLLRILNIVLIRSGNSKVDVTHCVVTLLYCHGLEGTHGISEVCLSI